jgi:uncharacterized protein YebE (UPF0316 family)
MDISFFDSDVFRWVVLPLLIFLARIFDVTIGTLRIMFLSRGNHVAAPLFGFFEVLVWLLAIGQIMKNLDNVFCYLAYAGGFAMGNFIGMQIEQKLAYGKMVLRVITRHDATELTSALRGEGFGVTCVDAQGVTGPVSIIFMVVDRTHLDMALKLVNAHNPNAFYTLEDTRLTEAGTFPKRKSFIRRELEKLPKPSFRMSLFRSRRSLRKGK